MPKPAPSPFADIPDSAWTLDLDALPEAVAARAFPGPGYIRDREIAKKKYDKRLKALQIELVKLQRWVRETGERVVVVFEGRDAAGKGGTIRRFTDNLNPRSARVVALAKPSDVEAGQWYFQRYVSHMPTRGEMVLFDRSWYNRAGVERVMGFCTAAELEAFFLEVPVFEGMLVREGLRLFKVWLTVERPEQLKRFYERKLDPLKQWKLSPMDFAAVAKWDAYSAAIADLLRRTDSAHAPWTVIDANDQRRARLNAIRLVLQAIDYDGKDPDGIGKPDADLVWTGPEFLAAKGW